MAYLDKPGLEAFWKKIKTWTSAHHAASMTKGASSQDGLQLMLKSGAESDTTLSTVTITKGDITALGIPGSNTTYPDATPTAHGLMSAADKKKLDGVEANANHYVHPTSAAGAKASGLYKVATDAQGHVTGVVAVAKSDISPLESDPTVPAWAKAATKPTYNGDEIDYDADGEWSVKEVLDQKQFIIADLATIRSGAAKGATAIQTETDPTVPAWAKKATKPSYEAEEIDYAKGGKTVSSALESLEVGMTSANIAIAGKQDTIDDLATIRAGAAKGATAIQTETDPTVPAWAKAASKPSYTSDEIVSTYADLQGSLTNVIKQIDMWIDGLSNKKASLASPAFTGTPTAPTAAAGTDTTQIATTAFVQSAVAAASMGAAKYKGGMSQAAYELLDPYKQGSYQQGWYWVIIEAGTYAGESCEAGDMMFCKTPSGHGSDIEDCFDIVQNNIEAIPLSVINALS